jgi:Polysaccharide pyruvyl transferase
MTADFLRELAPECVGTICLMPDPTMSFPVDLDAEVANLKKLKRQVEKKLCMVNLIDTPLYRELVNLLSKDYVVVEVGPRIKGSSTYYVPGPGEWCAMFNHFDLVVTASFHESIFSLKHQTPVIVIDCESSRYAADSGNSKNKSLMLSLDLEMCHINPEIKNMNAKQIYDRITQVRNQFDWHGLGSKLRQMGIQYRDNVAKAIEFAIEEKIRIENSNC